MGAFDCIVLPSLYEGLPVSIVEAQAAGVYAILSNSITPEVKIVPNLVKFLPVGDPSIWAAHLSRIRKSNSNVHPQTAYEAVIESPFNIANCISELASTYRKDD
jgi:glycosyltransferase involved in cell wall biosynthesis